MPKNSDHSQDHTTVVNFAEAREKRLEEKRRQNERVFFRNLLNVYSVTSAEKMLQIDLIEASEEGLSFHVPATRADAVTESNLAIRLYFSRDSYLEILVHIKNSKPSIENGQRFVRYGCLVDASTQSYGAYQLFIRFMKQYSLQAHRDLGSATAFY